MSLFGGDSSGPPTESEYESGEDKASVSITRSPPDAPLRSPPSAQAVHEEFNSLSSAAEDVVGEAAGNDADSEESDDDEPKRPNRFKGLPQTWKGYTAADRQLAESIQYLEDTDLAAHLYNAHALKRRARKSVGDLLKLRKWQNKDSWLKHGQDLQYKDAAGQLQNELIPSKDWTAWPLAPSSLYTLNDGFRRAALAPEEEEWTVRGNVALDVGKELKVEVLSLFLRLAKDNWNAKDWQDHGLAGPTNQSHLEARSQSPSADSDVDMKGTEAGHREDYAEESKSRPGRKPRFEQNLMPTILADDAKAHTLLRPIIATMLTKLDDIALALQRTRLNHFGHGSFGDISSQSEFTTDAETTERESRSRSRSRAKSALRSKPATRQSSRTTSRHGSQALTSPKKPVKPAERLADSDSASDYGARFGEKSLTESRASRSPTRHRKRRRSESTVDEEDLSSTRDWSRTGLMDWSEVLGLAAVKGWDQKALARTAERCAALFGESMSFLPLREDATTKSAMEPIQYTPSTIPAPSSIAGPSPPAKRPYWQAGAIRCPHPDCYGHQKDFRMAYRVIEHCMRIHGYDPRTNDSDNEERTKGGVHIDGFLQPITAKQGWLGHGRTKAGGKKRRTEESSPLAATALEADIEL